MNSLPCQWFAKHFVGFSLRLSQQLLPSLQFSLYSSCYCICFSTSSTLYYTPSFLSSPLSLTLTLTHFRHTLRCQSSSLHLDSTIGRWSKTSVFTCLPWWFHNGPITWTFASIVYAISHTVLWKITATLYWKAIMSGSSNAPATMSQDAIYHTCMFPLLSAHKALNQTIKTYRVGDESCLDGIHVEFSIAQRVAVHDAAFTVYYCKLCKMT